MLSFQQKLQDIQRDVIVPEEAQMLDLLDKDINLSIRNMFKELKENILMNESMRMMSHQIKNINKEYQ